MILGKPIEGVRYWLTAASGKYNPIGRVLADGHYSRRKRGSPQFMPPGQTIVLVSRDACAVFGWWRPHPAYGLQALNGLDGWTCSIFRNIGGGWSSELIIEAERALVLSGHGCGKDGMLTYVKIDAVRSSNPGYCFQVAGWRKIGWSADRKKRLLQKPFEQAGIAPEAIRTGRYRIT
jgi:hypothetical protein